MFKVKIKALKGLTGKTFVQELTRRKNELSKPMAGKLVGDGDSLDWVLYHEFGTATRRQANEIYGIEPPTEKPYRIPAIDNVSAKKLSFPDPNNKYELLDHLKNGYVITDYVYHPGVRPKFFIRNKLDRIRIDSAEVVVHAILNPNQPYSRRAVKEALLGPVMRSIIDHVSDGIGEALKQSRDDAKLLGEYPEQVFKDRVRIVDSSNEVTGTVE